MTERWWDMGAADELRDGKLRVVDDFRETPRGPVEIGPERWVPLAAVSWARDWQRWDTDSPILVVDLESGAAGWNCRLDLAAYRAAGGPVGAPPPGPPERVYLSFGPEAEALVAELEDKRDAQATAERLLREARTDTPERPNPPELAQED